jgi:DNA invertase Pin-like site-specific DNA recombinase
MLGKENPPRHGARRACAQHSRAAALNTGSIQSTILPILKLDSIVTHKEHGRLVRCFASAHGMDSTPCRYWRIIRFCSTTVAKPKAAEMTVKLISYLRVSTQIQGQSGLGLEAQRETVAKHAASVGAVIYAEYVEIESGKRCDRPQLAAALVACRATGSALLVAKLDRLARNARFLLSVVDGAGDAGVVFCDLPHIPAGPVGRFLLTQMAAVAELEAGLISTRTKSALAAAKARGVKLGGAREGAGSAVHAATARDAHSPGRLASMPPVWRPTSPQHGQPARRRWHRSRRRCQPVAYRHRAATRRGTRQASAARWRSCRRQPESGSIKGITR